MEGKIYDVITVEEGKKKIERDNLRISILRVKLEKLRNYIKVLEKSIYKYVEEIRKIRDSGYSHSLMIAKENRTADTEFWDNMTLEDD